MVNRPKKQNVSIQQIIAALLDDKNFFPPTYLHHFSDLEGADLAALRSIWPQVSANRRFTLLEDLGELSDSDTLVSFDSIARIAIEDEDPRVRTVGIELLFEAEDAHLGSVFLNMLTQDPDVGVRATAASALGLFVYLGELEEIPEALHQQVEDRLMEVVNGKDEAVVRQKALESLGFSGRAEVPPLIRKAYEKNDNVWLSSALIAMGRSADSAWAPEVTRMLRHNQTVVQLEAIRAAGELELTAARRPLLLMLDDELLESEIREATYWSLSKIGGDEVRETLEKILEETEDDEEAAFLEDALENLDFTEDLNLFEMFDMDDLPEEDETMEEYLARRGARLQAGQGEEDEDEEPGDTKGSASNPNKPGHESGNEKKRPRHRSK